MPRTAGVYAVPAGAKATSGTTISSTAYNGLLDDLVTDANAPRPVSAGGTGANTGSDGLTNLGVSAFAKTLLDDTSADAALVTLGLPPAFGMRNRIVDGRFDLWDQNALPTNSYTSAGYSAAILWRVAPGVGATLQVAKVAGPDDQTPNAAAISRTSGTAASSLRQRMENVRAFAGKSVRFQLMAKASAANTIALGLIQNFGTGGSPSGSVDLGTQSVAVGTGWSVVGASFTVPSLASKTLGSNGNDYLEVRIELPTAAGSATVTVALVQLALGTANTPFDWAGEAIEAARVSRLWERFGSFYSGGLYIPSDGGYCESADTFVYLLAYATKRAIPSVLFSGLNTLVVSGANVSNATPSLVGTPTLNRAFVRATGGTATGTTFQPGHPRLEITIAYITVDARL